MLSVFGFMLLSLCDGHFIFSTLNRFKTGKTGLKQMEMSRWSVVECIDSEVTIISPALLLQPFKGILHKMM